MTCASAFELVNFDLRVRSLGRLRPVLTALTFLENGEPENPNVANCVPTEISSVPTFVSTKRWCNQQCISSSTSQSFQHLLFWENVQIICAVPHSVYPGQFHFHLTFASFNPPFAFPKSTTPSTPDIQLFFLSPQLSASSHKVSPAFLIAGELCLLLSTGSVHKALLIAIRGEAF